METYKEAKEFCDRSSLLIPRVTCRDMDILSCLRAWRRGLFVLSKGQGGGPDFLFEGCGELHPFFLRVCSLPSFEKVKGDSQDLFSLPREKGGLFLPTEG